MSDIRAQITNLDLDEMTKKALIEKVGTETDPKKIAVIIGKVLDEAEAKLDKKSKELDKELAAADMACDAEEDAAGRQFDSAMAKLEKEAADVYVSTSRDMDALYAEDLKTGLRR